MNRNQQPHNIIINNFPVYLSDKSNWIVWKYSPDGKKPPISLRNLRPINICQPSAGASLAEAMAVLERFPTKLGLGFIFKGDGLVGIDLDDCVHDGIANPVALALLTDVGCQYVEVSPSGSGLHGIGLSDEAVPATMAQHAGLKVEIYDRNRYFTMTGNVYSQFQPNNQIVVMKGLSDFICKLRKGSPTQEAQDTQETHESQDAQEIQVPQDTKESQARGIVFTTEGLTFPPSCVPAGIGWRNRATFQLARFLKGQMPDATNDALYDVVNIWFHKYIDFIGTKDFVITWADFRYAWNQVRTPFGATLDAIVEDLKPIPQWMQQHRFGERGNNLLSICVSLAAHHDPNPFFLSGRIAHFLTGIDHSDCAKLLKVFTMDGFLVVIDPGNRRLARTYRLGEDPSLPRDRSPDSSQTHGQATGGIAQLLNPGSSCQGVTS